MGVKRWEGPSAVPQPCLPACLPGEWGCSDRGMETAAGGIIAWFGRAQGPRLGPPWMDTPSPCRVLWGEASLLPGEVGLCYLSLAGVRG